MATVLTGHPAVVTSSPPPDGRLSARFYLPALLLVVAGAERVVAGLHGSTGVLVLGVLLLVAGLAFALVVLRARRRH